MRQLNEQGKLIASIVCAPPHETDRPSHHRLGFLPFKCHGPWLLVSAKVLQGRTITCFTAIQDDVINAGSSLEFAAFPALRLPLITRA